MGWIGWTDKELKKIPEYNRCGCHYCYFRRIGKKEIEEQRNDF